MRCHLHRGDWSFHLTNEKKKNKKEEEEKKKKKKKKNNEEEEEAEEKKKKKKKGGGEEEETRTVHFKMIYCSSFCVFALAYRSGRTDRCAVL